MTDLLLILHNTTHDDIEQIIAGIWLINWAQNRWVDYLVWSGWLKIGAWCRRKTGGMAHLAHERTRPSSGTTYIAGSGAASGRLYITTCPGDGATTSPTMLGQQIQN